MRPLGAGPNIHYRVRREQASTPTSGGSKLPRPQAARASIHDHKRREQTYNHDHERPSGGGKHPRPLASGGSNRNHVRQGASIHDHARREQASTTASGRRKRPRPRASSGGGIQQTTATLTTSGEFSHTANVTPRSARRKNTQRITTIVSAGLLSVQGTILWRTFGCALLPLALAAVIKFPLQDKIHQT